MDYPLISCDDHMDLAYVASDLWQSRVPAKLRERAPSVKETPKGPVWFREGERWGIYGSKRADGRKVVFDEIDLPEEPEPGVFRPASPRYRIEDMDRDGIHAEVIYGFLDWSFRDHDLQAVCMQAYNSWLWEALCSADPDRLVGIAALPANDPGTIVAELHRVLKIGFRGATFDAFTAAKPIFDPIWEPLWTSVEETGVALSVHIGGGYSMLSSAPREWALPARAAICGVQMDEVLSSVIFSGILERHPKMSLVLGESGIGWIPFVLERLDWELDNYQGHGGFSMSMRPSELFRRQMYATFQDEKLGVRLIPSIGVDNVMWAADYPHADGTFPHTRQAVERIFQGVDAALTERVVSANCRSLYRIK